MTTYTTTLQERFAGELSPVEARLADGLRQSFRATLQGRQSFRSEAAALWTVLNRLRPFRYDVDQAIAAGAFGDDAEIAAAGGRPEPLSVEERQFIEDADGMVDWVTRNHVNFHTILATLGHDVGELSRHEFDLQKTLADFVVPKVSGWAKRNAEPVGEAEEQG